MKPSPAADRLGKILGGVVVNADWAYQARQVGVTPPIARRLLQGAAPDFQRGPEGKPAFQALVKRYANDMLRGHWRHSTITIGLVSGQDRYWLINGKHRLNAVVAAGDKLNYISVLFGVEILLCDRVDDVKAHALAADIGQVRSTSDLIQVSGLDLEGLDRSQIAKLQNSIGTLIHGFGKEPPGSRVPQEVFEPAVLDWAPAYRSWLEATSLDRGASQAAKKVAGALSDPDVIAIGLVTLRARPEQAAEFWRGVARAENEGWIGRAVELLGPKGKKLSHDALLRTLGNAWSAHVRQTPLAEPLRVMRETMKIDGDEVPVQKIPIFLAGTIYDGVDVHYYWPAGRTANADRDEQRVIGFNANYAADFNEGYPVPRLFLERRLAAEAKRKAEAEAAALERKRKVEEERARAEAFKAAEKARVDAINSMGLDQLIKSVQKLGWSRQALEQMSISQFRSIAINGTRGDTEERTPRRRRAPVKAGT